jgi:hypothetical protein
MRRMLLATIPVLLLAGCATAAPAGDEGAPDRQQRYRTTSTVLESRAHGPELCVGAMTASLPPQCGGLPLKGWSWDQVGGEQRVAGTTWGTYRMEGTYDGEWFTVTSASPAPQQAPPSHEEAFLQEPKSPCPEPPGGWAVPGPERAGAADLDRVARAARRQPDYAGTWISYLAPMGDNMAEDPGEFVLNLTFTGDPAPHERELRPLWRGRLCVARQQRTHAELDRIQRELDGAAARELGLRISSSGVRDSANAVEIGVLVLDERSRAALDARWGAGVVHASRQLTPVA